MNKPTKFILAVAPKNENVIIEKIVSSLIENDRPIFYKENFYSLGLRSKEEELKIIADTVDSLKRQSTYKDAQIEEANEILKNVTDELNEVLDKCHGDKDEYYYIVADKAYKRACEHLKDKKNEQT